MEEKEQICMAEIQGDRCFRGSCSCPTKETQETTPPAFNIVDLPKTEPILWPVKGNPDQYGNPPEQNGRRSAVVSRDRYSEVRELAKIMHNDWRERYKEAFPDLTKKSWEELPEVTRKVWLDSALASVTPINTVTPKVTMGLYATVDNEPHIHTVRINDNKVAAVSMENKNKIARIFYQNWQGERAIRIIIPREMYFGSTEYHPEKQWLLKAFDLDKGAERTFALKDILSWG